MTPINKLILLLFAVFSLLFSFRRSFSVHIPDISYFPVNPNYSESLASNKSNTIDISLKIEIPRTSETIDKFFLNWLIIMKLSNEKFIYSLKMTLLTNGNIYLNELRDGAYTRTFPPMLYVFPAVPVFDKEVEIGENMSFKLLKYYNKFSDPSIARPYYNIISGELKLLDQTCLFYFSKDSGIVMIKNGNEIFLER